MKNVYLVSGNKGGVGKSWVALTLVEFLKNNGKSVHIIETDDGNPDVLTPFIKHPADGVTGTTIKMDNEAALEQFIDTVVSAEEDAIVINAAAGDNKNLESQETFYNNISELDCELKVLWVCNAEKDGVVALKQFLDSTNAKTESIVVVMNKKSCQDEGNFGYLQSNLYKTISAGGGKKMFFPVLPIRIAQTMRDSKETFNFAMSKNLTNKLCAQQFLKTVFKNFSEVFEEEV